MGNSTTGQLLTLSREYHLRYREHSKKRLILEVDFEESQVVALMFLV